MVRNMPFLPQLLALVASLFFAGCFVAARRGLQHANPMTVTLLALIIQMVSLGVVGFFVEGFPEVSGLAVLLFAIVGVLMAIVRVLSFTGVAKIGAARGVPHRRFPSTSATGKRARTARCAVDANATASRAQ